MDITRSIVSERDRALLTGDHSVYHAQASRRIHTLRKRLKITTPKGRKYTPKETVTAEIVAANVEWVQLLLASAERSWASAMAMKAAQAPENTNKPIPGSTKRQIISRLRRASLYADNLASVLQERSSADVASPDVLEAKAYFYMLKGTAAFEQKKWSSCLQHYSLVYLVYTSLGTIAKTDVYKDLLSTYVEPSLRYAAYQSKMPRTKPVKDIVLENFPEQEASVRKGLTALDPDAFVKDGDLKNSSDSIGNVPTHITWRTRKVKLEDAAISQALGTAEALENQLEATYDSSQENTDNIVSAYDDIITARQDAADATKLAIDELTAEGVDPADPRVQSLQITRTAVNYAVIEWRIGRNRILCGSQDGLQFLPENHAQSSKPGKDGKPRPVKLESTGRKMSRLRERTALYDSILQSLDSVKELPGVMADEPFLTELDAKCSYFRALKCLAIGRSHALHNNITNALALYSRALSLAASANTLKSDSTSTAPKLAIPPSTLSNLSTHLQTLTTQFRALAELKSLSTTSSKPTDPTKPKPFSPPLIQSLHHNTYPDPENIDLGNLVNYPPKLQPIPVKPLFFDLAWNYIQYPGRERVGGAVNGADEGVGKSEVGKGKEEEKPAPARKGWFGFGRG
jgi:signal recognition particle subunit SRP68